MIRNARAWITPSILIAAVALLYTGPGMLSGRLLVPLDLKHDVGAWKPDPTIRYPVSNRLLSDVITEYIPWDTEISRLLRSGEMPWRNRWAGEGAPLFANPETALFSPFTWPRLLFGVRAWPFVIFLKLLITGIGMIWLAKELGASPGEATFSAFVLVTSGFAVVWAHYTLTNVLPWLPLLAAAALGMARKPAVQQTAAVIFFAAFATAGGHPETLFVGVTAIAILFAVVIRRNRLRVALAALAGFLLAAAQLVTFAYILPSSVAVTDRAPTQPFRLVAVAGQILPGFLGTPLRGEIDLSGVLPRGENLNERSCAFVGVITVVVVLLACRRLSRPYRAGLIVALATLLIAWRTPLLWNVIHWIPGLSLIAASRFAVATVLLVSLAAGPALSITAAARPRPAIGAVLMVAGLGLVVSGLIPSIDAVRPALLRVARNGIEHLRGRGLLQQPAPVYEQRLASYIATSQTTALRRFAVPGVFWAIGGIALAQRRRRRELLTVAVAGELLSFGFGYLPVIRTDDAPATPPSIADVKRLDPQGQWMIAAAHDVYAPNFSTEEQVRDIRRYDGLRDESARRAKLVAAGLDPEFNAFPTTLSDAQRARLAALGVRFLLAREQVDGTARVGGQPPPAVGVYEIPGARLTAPPANARPRGLALAIVTAALGLALATVLLTTAGRTELTRLETTPRSQ